MISIAGEALLRMMAQAQAATATLLHLVVRYIYTFISKPIDNEWADPFKYILYFLECVILDT